MASSAHEHGSEFDVRSRACVCDPVRQDDFRWEIRARDDHSGVEPRLRGWLGGQRRAGRHRAQFRGGCVRIAVGDQRLSASIECAAVAGRRSRRSLWPPAHPGIRYFDLRGWARSSCALAPAFGILVGGRLLQGVGAAMLAPNSLALLGQSFSGAGQRASGGHLGGGGRHRRSRRPRPWRLAHRSRQLAIDFPDQFAAGGSRDPPRVALSTWRPAGRRARRARRPRCHRGSPCDARSRRAHVRTHDRIGSRGVDRARVGHHVVRCCAAGGYFVVFEKSAADARDDAAVVVRQR